MKIGHQGNNICMCDIFPIFDANIRIDKRDICINMFQAQSNFTSNRRFIFSLRRNGKNQSKKLLFFKF